MNTNKFLKSLKFYFAGLIGVFILLCSFFVFPSFALEKQEKNLTSVSLPSSYSIYNTGLNSGRFTSNVGDQKRTDLCWAFASNTALESSIYTLGLVDASTRLNFSEADLAYNIFYETRHSSSVGAGAFEIAYEYYSSGAGPVNEGSWEMDLRWQDGNSYLLQNYISGLTSHERIKSGFDVFESKFFPSKLEIEKIGKSENKDSTQISEEILQLRNDIKNHIVNYGGVTAQILYSSQNLTSDYKYFTSPTSQNPNHLVTLVGYNDNITYVGAGGVTHKGAYIAQNSYGTTFGRNGYFYIMYDDYYVESEVAGFVRIGKSLEGSISYDALEGSSKHNQFTEFTTSNSYLTYSVKVDSPTTLVNFFETKGGANQKLSRIKVPTVTTLIYKNNYVTTHFKVYIVDDLTREDVLDINNRFMSKMSNKKVVKNKENLEEFSSTQTGFYTIETDESLTISGNYFAVVYEILDGALFYLNNNTDALISNPTYILKNNKFSIYKENLDNIDQECVLPLIVETTYNLKTIEYEITSFSGEYDGEYHSISVLSNVGKVTYSLDNITFNLFSPSFKDVNKVENEVLPYIIYVKIEEEFYKTVLEEVEVTITPKKIKITPKETSKIYGDSDLVFGYEYAGDLAGETPHFTGRIAREDGENYGKYKYLIGNLKLSSYGQFDSDNYEIDFDENKYFTIEKRPLIICPLTLNKVYGENDPEFAYTINNLVNDEKIGGNITLSRTLGEDTGSYDFIIEDELEDNVKTNFYASNYKTEIDNDFKFFTITKRPLYIIPNDDQHKTVDNLDPEFSYTFSGQVEGEEVVLEGKLERTSGEDVGEYLFNLGSLKLLDSSTLKKENYELVLTEKYFCITLGELKNVTLNDITQTYNGDEYFLAPIMDGDTIVKYCDGEVFSEENSTTQRIGKKDVGVYKISVQFYKKNYDKKVLVATITINPRTLFVTPKINQSGVYGQKPEIDFDYSNEVLEEIPQFSGSLNVEDLSTGHQTIVLGDLKPLSNGKFKSGNYILSLKNDNNITFEITKRPLVITPNSKQTKMYGKPDPVYSFSYEKLCYDDEFSSIGSLKREEGEFVGNFAFLQGDLKFTGDTDKNYYMVFNSNPVYFEILKADITIKIKDKYAYYGEISYNFTYEFIDKTNYVSGDDLNLTYSCVDISGNTISNTTRKNEEGYTISALSKNNNYNAKILEGKYFIKYKSYSVKFVFNETNTTFVINSIEHFSKILNYPQDFKKPNGYTFLGFKTEEDDLLLNDEVLQQEVTKNTTYIAVLEIINYSISFVLYGGTLDIEKQSYTILDDFDLPTASKTGYTFEGFYENESFIDRVSHIYEGTFGNKVFYAKFEIIKFAPQINGTSAGDSHYAIDGRELINFGSKYTFKVVLDREYNRSYKTMSVYIVNSKGEKELSPKYLTDANEYTTEEIVEDFEIKVENVKLNEYKISFIVDGVKIKDFLKPHGDKLDKSSFPQIPEKSHYTDVSPFWDIIDKDLDSFLVEDDLDIHAVYTPNVYTVTFILPNGKARETSVIYGDEVNYNFLLKDFNLGLFEYLSFDKDLKHIEKDETIRVSVKSSIYILYIIIAAIVILTITAITITIIRRKRRKFNWWVYKK